VADTNKVVILKNKNTAKRMRFTMPPIVYGN
jgi:hypothetical protein